MQLKLTVGTTVLVPRHSLLRTQVTVQHRAEAVVFLPNTCVGWSLIIPSTVSFKTHSEEPCRHQLVQYTTLSHITNNRCQLLQVVQKDLVLTKRLRSIHWLTREDTTFPSTCWQAYQRDFSVSRTNGLATGETISMSHVDFQSRLIAMTI